MEATRRNLFLRLKMKTSPVRSIPSVIQKDKFITQKNLLKSGRTKFLSGQP
jgi:hypothetical protein